MPLIRRAGTRRHQVALQRVTARTASDDGFVETWTTYATVWAAIQPATASLVERVVGATTQAPVTHLVETDYQATVSTAHRVQFGDRLLYIRGLQDIDERHITHVLACEERAA